MGTTVQHVILTRFNIPSPGRELSLRSKPGWLAGRFKLFEDYCLPSVAAQTERDFEWVIFFGEETTAKFRMEIERLQQIFPFHAAFTDLADMPDIIQSVLPRYQGADWLLSTRLDSDDILAIDHVARLREAIEPGRPQVINFASGAILSLSGRSPRFYRITDKKNPFASFLEPMGKSAKTIWNEIHVNISRLAPVTQVEGRPGWLQVVHGDNVSNRVKGRRVKLTEDEDIFPVLRDLAVAPERDIDILLENWLATPWRQARGLGRYIIARAKGL